jgi:histidinol-phosphate aminotransferase
MPAPKAWIAGLPCYEPGRPLEEVARELGLADAADLIKLASNENNLGPSPRAVAAMQEAASQMHLYPDGSAFYLRQALAERLDVTPDMILPGNGSNELIELLGHVFLGPGDGVVMSERAFIVYLLVGRLFDAEVVRVPMQGFTHDLEAMRAAITERTKLVFVANPNNPTGTCVAAADLDRFIRSLPDGVLAVLDEAYVELLPDAERFDALAYVREGLPVCVLRTFSKGYGLAGLRIGYAVGAPSLIELLNRARQPFNVNQMALVGALAALEDEAHLAASRQLVQAGLVQLAEGLDRLGVAYVPSCVNLLLVEVGAGRAVFEALQRQHVIVRPMDGYGLPEYIRVSVGTEQENARFLDALAAVRRGDG